MTAFTSSRLPVGPAKLGRAGDDAYADHERRVLATCPLTSAELRVLGLLMDGLTYREIAEHTGRAPSTIRSQLHSAYRRLGVSTSYQAVLECAHHGWLTWRRESAEQAALRRIEVTFRQLLTAVERHADHEDAELSARQHDYLSAFEQQLRARDPGHHRMIRARTRTALTAMLDEAGVELPTSGPSDLLSDLQLGADRSAGRRVA